MRSEPSPFENLLWQRLRNSQLEGFKFRRQTVIGPFICDFFCPSKGLVVEVDGDTHDIARDAKRDGWIEAKGFAVLRFTNAQVGKNIDSVLEAILLELLDLPDRFTRPHTPVLKGRGA